MCSKTSKPEKECKNESSLFLVLNIIKKIYNEPKLLDSQVPYINKILVISE